MNKFGSQISQSGKRYIKHEVGKTRKNPVVMVWKLGILV